MGKKRMDNFDLCLYSKYELYLNMAVFMMLNK